MPDTEPEVIQTLRRFKALLAQRDAVALQTLTRRWVQLERVLADQIELVVVEAQRRQAAGELLTRNLAWQMERYRALEAQLQVEMGRYADAASDVIAQQQRAASLLGSEHARALVEIFEPQIAGLFGKLPVGALEHMIGLTADGSTLSTYLGRVYPQAAEGMKDALLKGLTLGWNPRKTAAAMRDGTGVGLRTALNTARTETLRVYRQASLDEYAASGVVEGYERVAAVASARTCPACLLLDGRWFPLTTPFEEHVCGRCVPAPAVRLLPGGKNPPRETGRVWFEKQAPDAQKSILGNKLYDAWQGGKIGLDDVPVLHKDPVWGNSWRVASAPK